MALELLSLAVPPLQRLATLSCPLELSPCAPLSGLSLLFLLWPPFSPAHLVVTNTFQHTFSRLVLCVQNGILEIWETEDCRSLNSSDSQLGGPPASACGEPRTFPPQSAFVNPRKL